MPGGSPAKRVFTAVAAASSKPGAISAKYGVHSTTKEWKDEITTSQHTEDALPVQEDPCDVQPFEVWYWAEDGSFIPETMYLNAGDTAHSSAEPRLVVSLSNFEALSQAYAWSVEREGISKELLREKEETLARVRLGYFKELQHLREILDMARVQMRMAKSGRDLNEAEQRRMAEFESYVNKTDVNFFDIVECLDPELKAVMKNAVKQFNHQLMKETFDLKDRLSLYENSQNDSDLPGRLVALLMSKGHTPATMVKVISGFVEDKKQSDDFNAAMRDMLGISLRPSAPEPDEEDNHRLRSRRKSIQPVPNPSQQAPVVAPQISQAPDRSDVEQKLREELLQAKRQIAKMEQDVEARPGPTSVPEFQELQQQLAHAQAQADDMRKKVEQAVQSAQQADMSEKRTKDELDRAKKEVEGLRQASTNVQAKPEPTAEPKTKANPGEGATNQLKEQLAMEKKLNSELRKELEEATSRTVESSAARSAQDSTESKLRDELAHSKQLTEELRSQLQAARAQSSSGEDAASNSVISNLKNELAQALQELEVAKKNVEQESVGRHRAEQLLEKQAGARGPAKEDDSDHGAHVACNDATAEAAPVAAAAAAAAAAALPASEENCSPSPGCAQPADQTTTHGDDTVPAEHFAECERRRVQAENRVAALERRIAELDAHIRRLTHELRDTQVAEPSAFAATLGSSPVAAMPEDIAEPAAGVNRALSSQNDFGSLVVQDGLSIVGGFTQHLDVEIGELEGGAEFSHDSVNKVAIGGRRPSVHDVMSISDALVTREEEAAAPVHVHQLRASSKSSSASALANRRTMAPLPMQNVDLGSTTVASLAAHSPASSLSSKLSFPAAQDSTLPTRMPSHGTLDSNLGSLKHGPFAASDITRPSTGDLEADLHNERQRRQDLEREACRLQERFQLVSGLRKDLEAELATKTRELDNMRMKFQQIASQEKASVHEFAGLPHTMAEPEPANQACVVASQEPDVQPPPAPQRSEDQKLTAAMWKCRQAATLQFKSERQTVSLKKELAKLEKKLDLYKKRFGGNQNNQAEDAKCARCQATLVANGGPRTNSSLSPDMGADVESNAGIPTSSSQLRHELLGGARPVEDIVANMSDEELLFGSAGFGIDVDKGPDAAADVPLKPPPVSYRERLEEQKRNGQAGNRFAMLYADATARQNQRSDYDGFFAGSGESTRPSNVRLDAATSLSPESQDLLAHARQVRSLNIGLGLGTVPPGVTLPAGGSRAAAELDALGSRGWPAASREHDMTSRHSFSGASRRMRQRGDSMSGAPTLESRGDASSPGKVGMSRQRSSSHLPGISNSSSGSQLLASSMPDLMAPTKRGVPNGTPLRAGQLSPQKAAARMEADRSVLDLHLNVGNHAPRKVPAGRKLNSQAARMRVPGHQKKTLSDKSFILAASAFELGNHVRRHAEAEFHEMSQGREALAPAVHNLIPFADS